MIVETVALSTMVSNDLIMPVLLRLKAMRIAQRADVTSLLLSIRRIAIIVIVMLGYLYMRQVGNAYALVAIGWCRLPRWRSSFRPSCWGCSGRAPMPAAPSSA